MNLEADGDGGGYGAGGKRYATTVETLTQREPSSMLAAMFSGRHTLPRHPDTVRRVLTSGALFSGAVASEDEWWVQGMVFVDRDGKHFRHVLNWLRDGAVPDMSESEYQQLLREAEYYQLLVIGILDRFFDSSGCSFPINQPL